MRANAYYSEYTYKTVLNSAELMMLGCYLEDTESHHNKVSFCNAVFGVFNDRAKKSRQQLESYIDNNYILSTDSYPYIWVDKYEQA